MYVGSPDKEPSSGMEYVSTFTNLSGANLAIRERYLKDRARIVGVEARKYQKKPTMTQNESLDFLFDMAVDKVNYPVGSEERKKENRWGIEDAEILINKMLFDGVTFNDISDEKTYERLHAAVFCYNDTLVKVLLDMGTDPNATSGGESPIGGLCRCISSCIDNRNEPASLRIVTYLINAGAVVDIDPEIYLERNTPLCQLLIKHRKAQLASKG